MTQSEVNATHLFFRIKIKRVFTIADYLGRDLYQCLPVAYKKVETFMFNLLNSREFDLKCGPA